MIFFFGDTTWNPVCKFKTSGFIDNLTSKWSAYDIITFVSRGETKNIQSWTKLEIPSLEKQSGACTSLTCVWYTH